MTEAELKARLTPEAAASLPQRLEALGFSGGDRVRETDLYFNSCTRDFRETDEALRLRQAASGEKTSVRMTYKGPKSDSRSNTRQEHETTVGDLETARAILEALGFQPVFTVAKERRTLLRGAVTACLDRVEGLGDFLELEHMLPDDADREQAVDGLLRLVDELNIPRRALERRSYLELLMSAVPPSAPPREE